MDQEKNTKIIKGALYDISTREVLLKSKKKLARMYYILPIAVAMTLLLGAYYILQNKAETSTSKAPMLYAYSFPQVSKSRSSNPSIVELYIPQLQAQEYAFVLDQLQSPNLSEEDLYIKANLYYVLDSLPQAKALLANIEWQDPYFKEEAAKLLEYIELSK